MKRVLVQCQKVLAIDRIILIKSTSALLGQGFSPELLMQYQVQGLSVYQIFHILPQIVLFRLISRQIESYLWLVCNVSSQRQLLVHKLLIFHQSKGFIVKVNQNLLMLDQVKQQIRNVSSRYNTSQIKITIDYSIVVRTDFSFDQTLVRIIEPLCRHRQ